MGAGNYIDAARNLKNRELNENEKLKNLEKKVSSLGNHVRELDRQLKAVQMEMQAEQSRNSEEKQSNLAELQSRASSLSNQIEGKKRELSQAAGELKRQSELVKKIFDEKNVLIKEVSDIKQHVDASAGRAGRIGGSYADSGAQIVSALTLIGGNYDRALSILGGNDSTSAGGASRFAKGNGHGRRSTHQTGRKTGQDGQSSRKEIELILNGLEGNGKDEGSMNGSDAMAAISKRALSRIENDTSMNVSQKKNYAKQIQELLHLMDIAIDNSRFNEANRQTNHVKVRLLQGIELERKLAVGQNTIMEEIWMMQMDLFDKGIKDVGDQEAVLQDYYHGSMVILYTNLMGENHPLTQEKIRQAREGVKNLHLDPIGEWPLEKTRQSMEKLGNSGIERFDHPFNLEKMCSDAGRPLSKQGHNSRGYENNCGLTMISNWTARSSCVRYQTQSQIVNYAVNPDRITASGQVLGSENAEPGTWGEPLCCVDCINQDENGGVYTSRLPELMHHFGIDVTEYIQDPKERVIDGGMRTALNVEQIAQAVSEGRGVAACVNAEIFYGISENYGNKKIDHIVDIVSFERDSCSGKVTDFIIYDTNEVGRDHGCFRISVSDFIISNQVRGGRLFISDRPIW